MSTVILSIFAGLGGMIGWGLYDFFGGLYSKSIGNSKTFFWSQLAGLIFAALLTFSFLANLIIPAKTGAMIILASMIYAVAYLLFFKGFILGNVSIISATMNLWAVFTMIFAYIFLGQRLTPFQFLGVVLIIIGVSLVSLKLNELKGQGIQLLSGVKETVLAALLFGAFWIFSEILSEEIGWESTTLLVKIGVVSFMLLFSLFAKRELNLARIPLKVLMTIFIAGILEVSAVACVNWGLTVGEAILVTPISSALSIVTIGMAVVFLKEKISKLQGAGIVLVITGIVMTAF